MKKRSLFILLLFSCSMWFNATLWAENTSNDGLQIVKNAVSFTKSADFIYKTELPWGIKIIDSTGIATLYYSHDSNDDAIMRLELPTNTGNSVFIYKDNKSFFYLENGKYVVEMDFKPHFGTAMELIYKRIYKLTDAKSALFNNYIYTIEDDNYNGMPCYKITMTLSDNDNVTPIPLEYMDAKTSDIAYGKLKTAVLIIGKEHNFIYSAVLYDTTGAQVAERKITEVEFADNLSDNLFAFPADRNVVVAHTPAEYLTHIAAKNIPVKAAGVRNMLKPIFIVTICVLLVLIAVILLYKFARKRH